MKNLIICILILGFISPILCKRKNVGNRNIHFNVMRFGARGDGKSDDSNAFLRAWQRACGAQGAATMVIPKRRTFLVKKLNLAGPCNTKSISIEFAGKIVAPAQNAWVGDKSDWIGISNVNGLTVNAEGGLIDGIGSTWWQCKSCERPRALNFYGCNGLNVNALSMINSPGAHIAIDGCEGATFSGMNIHAPGHSPNTDGFDIASSKNILIVDSIIGTGDDCIAINGGSSYINVTRVACGPGHGISVGSLGKNNAHEIVEEIYVQNCSFTGTTNGARIKTWPGGSGYARSITFEQISLTNAQNPIIIDQNYGIVDSTNDVSAVIVSDVTYRGFKGTSADAEAINLDCSSLGCSNIVLDQINIISSKPGTRAFASCKNVHGTILSTFPRVSCSSHM